MSDPTSPLPTYRIEPVIGNSEAMLAHFRRRLVASGRAGLPGLEDPERLPDASRRLIKQVLAIDGVVSVSIGPFALVAYKAALFTWDEISPGLRAAVERFVNTPMDLAPLDPDTARAAGLTVEP
jgi:hypothetical protein